MVEQNRSIGGMVEGRSSYLVGDTPGELIGAGDGLILPDGATPETPQQREAITCACGEPYIGGVVACYDEQPEWFRDRETGEYYEYPVGYFACGNCGARFTRTEADGEHIGDYEDMLNDVDRNETRKGQ